jgi:hypothetical protein
VNVIHGVRTLQLGEGEYEKRAGTNSPPSQSHPKILQLPTPQCVDASVASGQYPFEAVRQQSAVTSEGIESNNRLGIAKRDECMGRSAARGTGEFGDAV